MIGRYRVFIIMIMCFTGLNTFAQQELEETSENGRIHKLALVFGYTHIPAGIEEGIKTKEVFVPTIGVDYFMQFAKGWKIGAVIDLELNTYQVDFNTEALTRENALVTGLLFGYEFANRWSFLVGPGAEFEKNKNIFILRASVEYEIELGNEWGFFPSFNYDFKKHYSTYAINIGISKRL
jgi:hypothetical protein